MIIVLAEEYRKKLGAAWRPGIAPEIVKLLKVEGIGVYPKISNIESDIVSYAEKFQWNIDHVVALVGPSTVEEIPDIGEPEDREFYITILKNGMVPTTIFVAPQIKDSDELIRLASRLTNMRAFL